MKKVDIGNDVYDAEQVTAAAAKVEAYIAAHPQGAEHLYLVDAIVECLKADAANPEADGPSDVDITLDGDTGETPADIMCRLLLLYNGGKDGRQWLLDEAPGQLDWNASHREQKFDLAKLPLDQQAIAKVRSLLVGTWYVIEIDGIRMMLDSATDGPAHATMCVDLGVAGLEYWDSLELWKVAETEADEDPDDDDWMDEKVTSGSL